MNDDEPDGPVSRGKFNLDDLEFVDSLPRQLWDEGKPITRGEVETLKAEFDQFVKVAMDAEAYALAAWVYYGGIKTARKMSG